MKTIIAISAGQHFSKKGDSIVRKKQKYLNFGLLGLVSLIANYSNHYIKMFQADDHSALDLLKVIEGSGINLKKDCECILLSIPSYHSITWCVDFCRLIKENYGLKIIVGGRWVVDNHVDWIKQKLKYVDIVSEGFGEKFYYEYFNLKGSTFDGKNNCFSFVDYTLLHNYLDYNPNIEISRGCGSGCHFCADRNNPRLPNKPVEVLLKELSILDNIYGEYTPYYTAPHFVFNKKWVDNYLSAIQIRSNLIQWRCTTRVESVPINMLSSLRESGLKIIDVGLESASIKQLERMHKTTNPKAYLEKAQTLIEECKKNDIWVKLNIMLYAGETMDTVSETMHWLRTNRDYIKDVSAGSLVYYYNMNNISELLEMGASIPEDENIEHSGYMNLNLSSEITKQKALNLCLEIPKIVANQKDFYDIKSFSYYPKSYSYTNFLSDLKKCDFRELPFEIV